MKWQPSRSTEEQLQGEGGKPERSMPHCGAIHQLETMAMAKKYGPLAGKKVHKAMSEMQAGKLHSGSKSGPKVTDKRQAIAIGLSQAKKAGGKVPAKKKG